MMKRGCTRALRSLPQLSDPLARVAGKGARAGAAADEAPAAIAALARALRRASAAGDVVGPAAARVVIYRRLMLRIAEQHRAGLAREALVTGEVVGQVASQTMENLSVIGGSPRCRCCGRSSGWTRRRSWRRRRGSARTRSQFCRTRTAARFLRPGTRPRRRGAREVDAAEASLPIGAMVESAAAATVTEDFHFPLKKVSSL